MDSSHARRNLTLSETDHSRLQPLKNNTKNGGRGRGESKQVELVQSVEKGGQGSSKNQVPSTNNRKVPNPFHAHNKDSQDKMLHNSNYYFLSARTYNIQ